MEQIERENDEYLTELEQANNEIKVLKERIASMTIRNSTVDAELDEIKV